ncbi:MAG: hypothetical protein IKG67_09540 [Parasporobacterium sp.]|nr:hypothetical protein [Parasporobacterium sp.]
MKKTMKLFSAVVVLTMILGVMPAAVYADGSYYVDKNYIVLSPGETATITLSADNAAGRVDWNSEGTVTAAGSEWLDNDSRTFTVTADSVGTGYINVFPTDIATGDDEVLDYGYTIQVEVVSDEPTPVQEPAPNDYEDVYTDTVEEEPVQQTEEPQQQAEEQPEEQAEAAQPLVAGDVLTDGNNYAGLSEEERLYTSIGNSELYIIRYPRWVDEEGNVVWNDEVYNLDVLPGFDLETVNYKEMNVDTFRYKDQITAFVLKNLETDRSNYYVLKDDGTGFEELSYVTANGKTYIVVDFPEDFVVPDGYQMVEMTLGSVKVQALKKAAEPAEMPAEPVEMPAEPVEEANGAFAPAAQKSVSIVTDKRTKVMLKGYETKVSPGLDSADPSGDLYYIYCLVDGQTQLYSYDSKEGTLQRASIVVYEEIPTEPETVIIYETAPAEETQAQTPAQTAEQAQAQDTAPAQIQSQPDSLGSFLTGFGWKNMQIQVKVLLIALAVAILLIIILIILFAAMSSRNRKRNRRNRKNPIPPRSAGRTAPLNEDDDAFFSYVKTDDDYGKTR